MPPYAPAQIDLVLITVRSILELRRRSAVTDAKPSLALLKVKVQEVRAYCKEKT